MERQKNGKSHLEVPSKHDFDDSIRMNRSIAFRITNSLYIIYVFVQDKNNKNVCGSWQRQ